MISLQADRLTKKYNRKTVLHEISFMHTEGVLGIAGANGSGKSTLLKCLSYLLRAQSGQIYWSDAGNAMSREEVKSVLGYTAPYINLYEDLTAFENLEFLAKMALPSAEPDYINNLLSKVQMEEFGHQLFKSLSTGQQQRIKLAAGLIRKPRILFLDEPGSNLDEKGRKLVSDIVTEQKSNNCLVVIASNDPQEIELCDQVIELGIG